MKDEGSRTAEFSAAQKALHTLHGDDPKIFVDPFALGLSGPRLKWVVGPRPMAWLFQRLFSWTLPLTAHNLVRSQYVEARLDKLLDAGLEQYVILGAGMDSFALRRKDLTERLVVFEIDHPRTQAAKRQRIAAMGWSEPDNVTYVPIDFERQTLLEALNQTGFDGGKLTLFSCMGVIQYLTEESIVATMADVAAAAASGSEIAFNTLEQIL